MQSKTHNIHEMSLSIPIKQNLSTPIKICDYKNEYSLKQNFFDPSKSSPPNNFMIKLNMRMTLYNNKNYLDSKDDSFDNE
jgi:hypothetical protein